MTCAAIFHWKLKKNWYRKIPYKLNWATAVYTVFIIKLHSIPNTDMFGIFFIKRKGKANYNTHTVSYQQKGSAYPVSGISRTILDIYRV